MRSRLHPLLLVAVTVLLSGCGEKAATVEDFNTRPVTLPNGKTIHAELMVKPEDMMRGMMFRESVAPDHGMLFFHASAGKYKYWMYQVKIPLDIIWMDANHKVVEISPNTPPCKSTSAQDCTNYGGNEDAKYVLELGGGGAARNNIKVGDVIQF